MTTPELDGFTLEVALGAYGTELDELAEVLNKGGSDYARLLSVVRGHHVILLVLVGLLNAHNVNLGALEQRP